MRSMWQTLAKATVRAKETAYKAVMKPKEGTILTVARGMAEKAEELAETTEDLDVFIPEVIKARTGCSGADPGDASGFKRSRSCGLRRTGSDGSSAVVLMMLTRAKKSITVRLQQVPEPR